MDNKVAVNKNDVTKRVLGLIGDIKESMLPKRQQKVGLEKLENGGCGNRPSRPSSEDILDASLDHLQLWTKYLLFDLEATRRENQCLRKLLERGNKKG
jgi:hypothetical protein